MKAAYTGWTWITSREAGGGQKAAAPVLCRVQIPGLRHCGELRLYPGLFPPTPRKLVEMTKECGVELVNLYGHFTFDVEEAIRVAKEQIDFCAAVGVKWNNCQNAGFGDDGPSERPTNPELLDKMCYVANTLGAYAKERGVTLCFHPHYGTCVFWQSDIDYFAEHTDPQYVSFCFDTAHTTLAGMDPAALIRQYGERIALHAPEGRGHPRPEDRQGPDKMGTFRALGHGTVDFPK